MHHTLRKPLLLSAALCGTLLAAAPAHAQATRTWVSGVGDDANPCSRTAPCKTFAGAISKTANKGEIDIIDAGSFGAVTITKSITIDGNGQVAGILAAGTNGITVNGAGVVVTLRNLSINGAGTGLDGIRFLNGDTLVLDNVKIGNFTGACVDVSPTVAVNLAIHNTVVTNCTEGGIQLTPAVSGSVDASITDSRVDISGRGILAEDRTRVTISNTTVAGNNGPGFFARSIAGGTADMSISGSVATGNVTAGVRAGGAATTVRIGTSAITNNLGVGLQPQANAALISFGNNQVSGNTLGDGNPTATAAMK